MVVHFATALLRRRRSTLLVVPETIQEDYRCSRCTRVLWDLEPSLRPRAYSWELTCEAKRLNPLHYHIGEVTCCLEVDSSRYVAYNFSKNRG